MKRGEKEKRNHQSILRIMKYEANIKQIRTCVPMVCVHTCITRFQCKIAKKVLRNIALRSLVSSLVLSTKTEF